jgi:3-hydroxyisobutyrate dehydrogenase
MNASGYGPVARKVGFAGLGVIGEPMARRILGAGFVLHVWNRTAGKADSLVAAGANRVATPAALASEVDVLCICVTDARALEELVFGVDGIAAAGKKSLIIVDHSTVHPAVARDFARRVAHVAGTWLDVPVTGGPAGARQGNLTAFAGGESAAVEYVRPVVASFAKQISHLGPVGSGQAAKACNQMLSFGTAAVLAEALNLASRMGLDVAQLPGALEGGLADSAVLRRYAPGMVSGELTGSALTALKDLEIILELGRETSTPMPITGLVGSLHRLLSSQGHHLGGMAGLVRLYCDGPLRVRTTQTTQVEPTA